MIGFGWGYRIHAASHKQLGACGLKHAASNNGSKKSKSKSHIPISSSSSIVVSPTRCIQIISQAIGLVGGVVDTQPNIDGHFFEI
jgi:hypothetical protein